MKKSKDAALRTDRLIIGHVARFHEVKNHAFLLKLAAHLKERGIRFQLVLAGDGPLCGEIEGGGAAAEFAIRRPLFRHGRTDP